MSSKKIVSKRLGTLKSIDSSKTVLIPPSVNSALYISSPSNWTLRNLGLIAASESRKGCIGVY